MVLSMMAYEPGSLDRDECIAQIARDYVNAVGVERASVRAAECERFAKLAVTPETYRKAFERHATALRDAIEVVKTTKTLRGE
jgi:hypothetical protein